MRPFPLVLPTAALVTSLSGAHALAQDTPLYLDDRSDAAAIVKSLYNAVNRKEYARAWDYFGDQKPAEDIAAFIKGYENTAQVIVTTGNIASEGAAGSIFYHVPVAILSSGTDGSEQVFAGCYTARLANPAIQEPPFQPLHIEKGHLKPSDLAYEEAVPANCPGAPAPEATDAIPAQAKAAFEASHSGCDPHSPGSDQAELSEYKIPFRYVSDADDQPERQARLFRFYCGAGAYNETHVYYQYDETNGLRELQFATPELDIRYENDDLEGKVEGIAIIGYRTVDTLVNSSYDEAEHSITAHNRWRGIGDAGTTGTWIFRDGQFTLVKYDVDASYDGEINPETVLDFHTAP